MSKKLILKIDELLVELSSLNKQLIEEKQLLKESLWSAKEAMIEANSEEDLLEVITEWTGKIAKHNSNKYRISNEMRILSEYREELYKLLDD